jgi:hypothetical protein
MKASEKSGAFLLRWDGEVGGTPPRSYPRGVLSKDRWFDGAGLPVQLPLRRKASEKSEAFLFYLCKSKSWLIRLNLYVLSNNLFLNLFTLVNLALLCPSSLNILDLYFISTAMSTCQFMYM